MNPPAACEDNSQDIDWDTLYNSLIIDQGNLGSNVNTSNAAGNASATRVGTTGLENLDLDSLPDFTLAVSLASHSSYMKVLVELAK